MKTTIDLPEDLVRQMKLRAVREGRKLREVAEEVFRRGLDYPAIVSPSAKRGQIKLPLIACGAGAPAAKMTAEQLIAAEQQDLSEEDLQRAGLPL